MLLVGALILLATLTPRGEGAGNSFLGLHTTIWHVLLFAFLGVPVALRYATSQAAVRSPVRVLLMVVMAIWLFAALTELGQGLVDGRDPDLADWVADMAGALIGLALGSVALRLALARGR